MTGAILAGGKSVRMGFNKALIKLDGETIIERTARLFKGIFSEMFIVANEPLLYGALGHAVVADVYKACATLGGMHSALFHSSSDYTFIAACDMPRLDEGSIRLINACAGKCDAVIPYIGGRFHPMHALYSKRCIKPMEAMLKAGELRVGLLIEKLHVKKLTEDDFKGLPIAFSVENVNTPEDIDRLKTVAPFFNETS